MTAGGGQLAGEGDPGDAGSHHGHVSLEVSKPETSVGDASVSMPGG